MFSKALRLSKVRVMSFSVSVVVAGIPAGPINMLYPESFGKRKYSDIGNFVENPQPVRNQRQLTVSIRIQSRR
jgi:hypothetical protein